MLEWAMAQHEYPPRLTLTPVAAPVQADVRLPGSKSITNRALLLAALADGVSTLRGPLHSEDTLYMIDALRNLGVIIKSTPHPNPLLGKEREPEEDTPPLPSPQAEREKESEPAPTPSLKGRKSIDSRAGTPAPHRERPGSVAESEVGSGDLVVHGRSGGFDVPAMPTLFIGNSGTTVRFLTAAACLMPAGADVVLDGVARMRERPIRDLLGALIALGANVESVNGHGCPPVRVHGGGLGGGSCAMRGDVSSQFLTALLQVAPFAREGVEITIIGELISKPYIDITQSVMGAFGATFENDDYRVLRVPAGQCYHAADYQIEADASNASYFLAAAAVTGGRVCLTNLSSTSIQGDVRFADVLERMGCTVTRGDTLTVQGPTRLRAIDVDMDAIPDTAQTLAVAAAFADGPCHITGIASLRVKETDRIAAVTKELTKLGVRVEEGAASWTIYPLDRNVTGEVLIDTYQDHRMAMSFAVAGLRIPGIVIDNPGCVAKTFPDFWQRWHEATLHDLSEPRV
jgi:3-phosphoshikimate 1-carboxyvinyltransferase